MMKRASARGLLGAVAWGLVLAGGATGCGADSAKHRARAVTPVANAPKEAAGACGHRADRPVPPAVLDALAMLTTDAPRAGDARGVVTEGDLPRFIDSLVDDERFARDVAPRMLASYVIEYAGSLEYPMMLSVDDSSGTPVYYYPPRKCEASSAVDVHPWWALDTTVKVCPTSYQPDHLRPPIAGATGLYCGNVAHPSCGCGPNLVFCVRDGKQKADIIKSTQQEGLLLVARIVKNDLPLDRIWTANETERDRNAELVYRRWRISAGEPAEPLLASLKDWPTTPVLAPRHEQSPRQHAGLLTFSGSLGLEASIRARMKWFYQSLWCDEPPGGNVATEAVLALKAGDVRNGAGWQDLATKPICTDCHARLDYGGQFFSGFGVQQAYDPKEHIAGEGKLYAKNIDDYRGKASLDPRSFGELVVAQPEFSACVVKNVKRRVFDDVFDTTHDDALEAAFRTRRSLKAVMRAALRAYAERRLSEACAAPETHKAAELEERFDTYCRGCHGPNRLPDFAQLSDKGTLKLALGAVAFGQMPRSPMAMPAQERRQMTELLIQRIWTDEPSRLAARSYFDSPRPVPVHGIRGVVNMVNVRAGTRGGATLFKELDELGKVEEASARGDLLRYTPGVESIISLEALAACKAAGHAGAALEACVARATDLSNTVRARTKTH